MKLFIILLAISTVGIFLGCRVFKLQKKIKQLQMDRNDLIKERAAQSDQLRLKGIEIDRLKKELDKYSNVEPKVALIWREKQMILDALDMPYYRATIQTPATPRIVRDVYRGLKEKIKESTKEEK